MGKRVLRLCVLAGVVAIVGAFAAVGAGASNGIGPPPQLPPFGSDPGSQAFLEGYSVASDGVTPSTDGIIFGGFLKGDEQDGSGNTATTIVNFELPAGVTIAPGCEDSGEPSGFILVPGYCLAVSDGIDFGTCPAPTNVSVSGDEVSFTISCDIGQDFFWEAEPSSLITTPGLYDAGVVFKVGSTKRTKATNMWKIPLPQTFEVDPAT